MTKQPFWKRLGKALAEEEEESAADIDRAVEDAVKAIQRAEVSAITTKDVFAGWGEGGGKVFVMDMAPIYRIIGGRSDRLAAANKLICERVFQGHVVRGLGRFSFEGDHFVMRFGGLGDAQAFQLAIDIVNAIGAQILGDRFHVMAVPGLVVVADLDTLLTHGGTIDAAKLSSAVTGGGIVFDMAEPPAGAPEWQRLQWKNRQGGGSATGARPQAVSAERLWRGGAAGMTDPAAAGWRPVQAAKAKPGIGTQPHGRREATQFAKRKGEDRRKVQRPFAGPDRRESFDRRGRGY